MHKDQIKLIQLNNINDNELNENYTKDELEKIAINLNSNFDELFEE